MGEVLGHTTSHETNYPLRNGVYEQQGGLKLAELLSLQHDEWVKASAEVKVIEESERGHIYAEYLAGDPQLARHSHEVATLAAIFWTRFVERFGPLPYTLHEFIEAGLVHDHGKMTTASHGVKGVFSPQDRLSMEEHPITGALFALKCTDVKVPDTVVALVLLHHAHLPNDGDRRPYPQRNQLPKELAEIWDCHQSPQQIMAQAMFAVADVVCAVMSPDRGHYRQPIKTLDELIAIIDASFGNPHLAAIGSSLLQPAPTNLVS